MASAASGSSHLSVTENQKRWLVAGIALNKILIPQIRPHVEQGIKTEYNNLKTSHNIDGQSTSGCLQRWPPRKVLKYENINRNGVHPKLPGGRYNYALFDCRVTSHVDFARLYVENYMAKFNAFDDHCDASAVMALLGGVPVFSAAVQTAAGDVRMGRNDWAHCVYSKWDEAKFQQSFIEMEHLAKVMALPVADEEKVIAELKDWESKGTHLCMNSPVDPVLLQLVQHELKTLQDAVENMSVEFEEEKKKVQHELQNVGTTLEEMNQRLQRLETGQQNLEYCTGVRFEMLEQRIELIYDSIGRPKGRVDNIEDMRDDFEGGLTIPQEIRARGPLAVQIYNEALKEGKTNVRRLPIMLIGQHRMGKTSLKKSLKGDLFDAEEESTTWLEVDPSYFKMTTEIWRLEKLDETTCSDSAISFEHQARDCIKVEEEEQIYSILWDFGGQSVYYVTHPINLSTRAIYLLVYDLSRSPYDRAIPAVKQGLFRQLKDSCSVKTNLDYLESWMSSVASLVSDGDDDDVPASHETEKLPSKLPPVFLVCTHADEPYCGRDSAALAAEVFGSLQGKPYSSHLFGDVFAVDNRKSGSEHHCPEVVRLRNEILAVAKELPQTKEEIPLKWLKFEMELQVKIKEGCKWISLENAKQVALEMCHISEDEFVPLMTFLHDQRILIHFHDTPSLNRMVVLDIQWLIDVFKKVITIEPYHTQMKQYRDLWLKLEKTGILEEKLLEHVWGPLYEHKETFESLIEMMERFSLLCIWPSSDKSKQYLVPSMLMSHPSEDIIRLVASSQIPSLYLTFNSSQVPIGLFPRMVVQFNEWCSKEWPSPCKPQLYHNFARFFFFPDEGCSVILLCHSSFIEIAVHRANKARGLSERLQVEMKFPPNLASDPTPDVTIARAVRRQVGLMLECMRKEFVWLKNMECEMKVLCPVCCPGGSVHYCRDHATTGCKQEECLHFWSETNLQSGQQFVICDKSAVAGDPILSIKQFASWFTFLDEQKQAIVECAARELPSIEDDASNVLARLLLQDHLQLNQAELADPEPETTWLNRRVATIAKNEGRLDVVQHLREISPAGTTEKETKTLLLSTGVLESLQSTCDALNVVARLQDHLQLNQAALADPEPETTRLIRCLATIAKNEDRLDVVQHLRQITPAGTTGPLLPEPLDVRNIPPSQIRELTITLSGGDEWKLVAERLGLNQAEIRYLDRRTMNPCEAALMHSRNQRFINVDTLYNVLVECGLRMLADLL